MKPRLAASCTGVEPSAFCESMLPVVGELGWESNLRMVFKSLPMTALWRSVSSRFLAERGGVAHHVVVELSRQAVCPTLVVVDELVQPLEEGPVVDGEPALPMPDNLKVMHLVSCEHGEHEASGHSQALPDEEQSLSSCFRPSADQVGRVLASDSAVEPAIWLGGETHGVAV